MRTVQQDIRPLKPMDFSILNISLDRASTEPRSRQTARQNLPSRSLVDRDIWRTWCPTPKGQTVALVDYDRKDGCEIDQKRQARRKTSMEYLVGVPNPRGTQGKRFEWHFLLEIIYAAVVGGKKCVRGVAEWVIWHAKESLEEFKPAQDRIPSLSALFNMG